MNTDRTAAMRAYSARLDAALDAAGHVATQTAQSNRLGALLDSVSNNQQRARALGLYAPRIAPAAAATPPKSLAQADRYLRQIANRVLGA